MPNSNRGPAAAIGGQEALAHLELKCRAQRQARARPRWQLAECGGRRFLCTENIERHSVVVGNGQSGISKDSDVSCTAEYSSAASSAQATESPAERKQEPPSSGAGFALGSSAEAAKAACEGAGHQWQPLSASQASCYEAVTSIGIPTSVELGLCAGAVCRVTLVHAPERSWLNVIADLRSKLEAKYAPRGAAKAASPKSAKPPTYSSNA